MMQSPNVPDPRRGQGVLTNPTRERLIDIRDAARDLRDFAGTIESGAFHALRATNRMAHRAVKNALVRAIASGWNWG